MMDVLSDVLNTVHLTGAIFFERHLHAPWVGESPHSAAIASAVMVNDLAVERHFIERVRRAF